MRRHRISLGLLLVLPLLTVSTSGHAEDAPCAETFCVGAASVDMTWHTGAGQGQYATEGNGFTSDKFDPFHHQTKQVPSDGMQSRLFAKAVVAQGADGEKVAYVKTELYLQQDVLTRRVAQLVSGADPAADELTVEGLDGSRIMLGGTHNHSAPSYASTAWGVWLFTDTFDARMFEATARRIARAIKEADAARVPARMGASVTRFDEVQRNILGPAVADDGTPAGFPHDVFDDELAVVRFDTLDGSPIAAFVNLGMHPESMDTFDLISGDFVGMVERIVERGMGREPGADAGPVVAWSQGAVGDVEPDRDGLAHPDAEKREYWHRDVAQAERMSRDLADAVLDTWDDVSDETPDVPEKFVPLSDDVPVGMVDRRYAGPVTHPTSTVSNCRTEHPGVPVVGLPDCERGDLEPPEQYGTTLDLLQEAGIPVPDNYGVPSHGAVQESQTIHLQAMRLGDVLLASCPCEPISDMVLNFKSRADTAPGDMYLGHEWPCTDHGDRITCDFRTADHHPSDVREVDRDAYERMVAEIRNDAAGWEDDLATLQGEVEAEDPDEIYGNFTHTEVQELGSAGYRLPLMVGQANDYIGYVVTYREYMRGDHYRKALTAFGPHTADYVNTRLVGMGAELRGADAPGDGPHGDVLRAADEVLGTGKAAGLGTIGAVRTAASEAAIPDDGGTPGLPVAQPDETLERFDAASFTWEGGSNWTDNPHVTVERLGPDGDWTTAATQAGGEVVLTLDYESPLSTAPLDWLGGNKTYRWTATYEVFEETDPGTYRFAVRGHHRHGREPVPYATTSRPFTVDVWRGIAAHDLVVDKTARTASFRADGVELVRGPGELETDDDARLGPREIHYPETYETDLAYVSESFTERGGHVYCWRCTFRPWANTGQVASAEVTVREPSGRATTYAAALTGDRWVATGLRLPVGATVVVEPGGVVDEHGNVNGEPSESIEIRPPGGTE